MAISLARASVTDADTMLALQRRSFLSLLERYQDTETNPAAESPARMVQKLSQPQTYFYFILAEGLAVGGIRIVDPAGEPGQKRVSPLFILPEWRGRGYARQAMLAVEALHGAGRWRLETILQEPKTCRFYEALGYLPTGHREAVNERLTLVYYEKDIPAPPGAETR